MYVVVAILTKFFGHIQQVNVRRCHFLVMFKDFGHIESVMLTTLLSVCVNIFLVNKKPQFIFVSNFRNYKLFINCCKCALSTGA